MTVLLANAPDVVSSSVALADSPSRTVGSDVDRESSIEGGTRHSPHQRLRGIARHSLVYALGLLLSKVVSFVMLPIYTRYLTPGDYGVMELIGMTLDIIAMIAGAGMATGIFRYYHKAESEAERLSVVSTALQMLASSYLIVAVI